MHLKISVKQYNMKCVKLKVCLGWKLNINNIKTVPIVSVYIVTVRFADGEDVVAETSPEIEVKQV